MKSVGFKEWALVCEALGRGEQRIIIRKGGIAEGGDGFSFKHREFFLFPTFFHEQLDKVRMPGATLPRHREGEIQIRYFVEVADAKLITRWEEVEALEPLHVLKPEVVRERFGFGPTAGVHVAWVSVTTLDEPWILPELPAYRGCKSWVELPEHAEHLTRVSS
ncbi:MAG: DUF1802 family protein [Chthoniobacterales bacterium]